ncbi:MAG: hypothetical protein WCA08_07590 [Desulfoferrobacter sp.]
MKCPISRIFRCRVLIYAALCLFLVTAAAFTAFCADEWTRFADTEEQIQFLSIGTPQKNEYKGPNTTTTSWTFGHLEDGTNGYVDATRLDQGSFAGFNVLEQAAELRAGVEKNGKTEVIEQRPASVSGQPAIEFRTKMMTSRGTTWYGVLRMFVIEDTLFTVGVIAPSPTRLETDQVQTCLNSLERVR